MDYTLQIASALNEKLDIATAFPIVFNMTQQTIEMFVGSVFQKLGAKIQTALNASDKYVAEGDALGLALALMRDNVKLPTDMLLEICTDVLQKARHTARFILPTGEGIPGTEGGVWYCKLYIDLSKEEVFDGMK